MLATNSKFQFEPWKCPICPDSEAVHIGVRGGKFQRNQLGEETHIKQCISCSLIYPDPFPIPTDIQALYGNPEEYFAQHISEEKVQLNRDTIRKIKGLTNTEIEVLDVGSGTGELVVAAKLEGVKAIGIELSEAMIAYAKKRYNLSIEKISIEEAAKKWPRRFDAIILNAVLEHAHRPQHMIEAAAALLKKDGIIYIDVPNEPNLVTSFGNAWNRIRGNQGVYNLSPTWPPYHVYGFNPKSLRLLLEKNGFSILSCEIFAPANYLGNGSLSDQIKAFIANQIARIANWTGTSSNLVMWARFDGKKP